jgi:FixJ family two-component response regulator
MARVRSLGIPDEGGKVPKSKPLISVVDDDEAMREALRRLMKSLGYTAEAFASAEDFLSSRQIPGTSCLIADVQMPGMTGLELYHHLVAAGKTIPTILITAYPDDSMRERALGDGVVCYLSKPFDENDLLACIHSSITI